jgi:mono/diheme cytochrome c family protein
MTTTPFRPFFLALLLATACGGGDGKAAQKRIGVSPARREAIEVFQSLCVTCHGTTGKGDGPGAAACNPRPRAFGDQAWQASVTDEQIVRTVLFGGAAVGKSAQMPAQPQLKGKDELLQNLVGLVRAFAPSR